MHRKSPIIASVSAVLVLFAVMSALTDFPLLDTMWRATASEIHRAVSVLTAAQIRAYRIMLTVDFGYAVAYTSLLVLLFRFSESNQGFRGLVRRTGIAAALVAGLSDCIENALILAVLNALPGESTIAGILGTATTTKWIAVATAVGLLGVKAVLAVAFGSVLSRDRRRRSE